MAKHFFTMAQNQIVHHFPDKGEHLSGGMVVVEAPDKDVAREIMTNAFGMKWAFQYDDLEQVHPADRIVLAELPAPSDSNVNTSTS